MILDWDKWNMARWLTSPKGGIDKELSDLANEHRFIVNYENQSEEGCTCGWTGKTWADHFEGVVKPKKDEDEKEEETPKKAAPKKITLKASE